MALQESRSLTKVEHGRRWFSHKVHATHADLQAYSDSYVNFDPYSNTFCSRTGTVCKMADNDDLKTHALNSSHDFYTLLDVSESAQETEIRRAYRKTALKYHPDKVGPANTEAIEKFHLLQIAYDVLSDPTIKELYDNARRARQAKADRDKAYEGRRKWMKEDLERRETGAFKRKREEVDAEEQFERELRRLAEDGKRRRKEREEQLRREAMEMDQDDHQSKEGELPASKDPTHKSNGEVADIDRSVTLRFPQNEMTKHIDKSELISRFSRFGEIEDAVLREKKIKIEGEKHRQAFITAVLVFKSVVGAHAAVTDFPKLVKVDEKFTIFEAVDWAAGKEPDYIPKTTSSTPPFMSRSKIRAEDLAASTPDTPAAQNGDGSKKVPSFGSFKGAPASAVKSDGRPSVDEITMIRLKNAERRRMEAKIRKEEEAAAAAGDE